MTEQEARRVTATCERFRSAKSVADKEEALDALKSLADQGNIIALHELGQWQFAGDRESDKDQGLALHIRAAERGYIPSLVAIQGHEDPLGRKYDLLSDPSPFGLDKAAFEPFLSSRFARIAALNLGLASYNVHFYGKVLAELLVEEINPGAAAPRVGRAQHVSVSALVSRTLEPSADESQLTHIFAEAHTLLQAYYKSNPPANGPGAGVTIADSQPGSVEAVWKENPWDPADRRARKHLAETSFARQARRLMGEQTRAFCEWQVHQDIPKVTSSPRWNCPPIALTRFLAVIDKVFSHAHDEKLASYVLAYLLTARLGFTRQLGLSVAQCAVKGYHALGGHRNLPLHYNNLLREGCKTIEYATDAAPEGRHANNGFTTESFVRGINNGAYTRRGDHSVRREPDVIVLDDQSTATLTSKERYTAKFSGYRNLNRSYVSPSIDWLEVERSLEASDVRRGLYVFGPRAEVTLFLFQCTSTQKRVEVRQNGIGEMLEENLSKPYNGTTINSFSTTETRSVGPRSLRFVRSWDQGSMTDVSEVDRISQLAIDLLTVDRLIKREFENCFCARF